MKPARFEYLAPTSVEEAVSLLVEGGEDAKLLAGGQSLVPLMNLRLAQPSVLIDLNKVEGISSITESEDAVVIGSMARHRAVAESEVVRRFLPLLAESAGHIGYPAIRARGTIGGSIAHADPVSEFPCACLCLHAEFVLTGPAGTRQVRAEDFFVSYLTTALSPDEILTEVRFPKPSPGLGWGFLELARKTGDFALAAVAATVALSPDGTCSEASIAVAGGGDRPLRMVEAETMLKGNQGDDVIARAATAAATSSNPPSDIHSSGDFRRQMIEVLTRRVLTAAWGNARRGE
ncbi:MAG: xanthine dehydrogenase family protein subunit M [Actinobacteria bacterium]|nr:xanthine dehydrogenase family protein subunit M [Actinomycetota bacterium]